MTVAEFSRPERIETIGDVERSVSVSADAGERAALAARFGVVSIARLDATFAIRRVGDDVRAQGRVTGALVQACSVTGDAIDTVIDEAVSLRFVRPGTSEDEIELADDALDTIEIAVDGVGGGEIDLGEAAAETMALAIDPFVRSPRAEAELRAAGVIGEDEVGNAAFSGLAALKARLEGR